MNTEWIALTACVIVEQNNKCAMCGKELEDYEFTLHHIKPRDEGGKDELYNLIGLCDMCHDIAEYKKYNREEIVNCRYIDYPNIKRSRFINLVPPKRNNEPEYDYPEVIILQEKYTGEQMISKTIMGFEVSKELKERIIKAGKNFKIGNVTIPLTVSQFCRIAIDKLLNEIENLKEV